MIAAIYARKSTDEGQTAAEDRSVGRQVAHARDYATSKGWTVPDDLVFIDDGVSGAEFSNRPAFLRLMNSLKPKAPFQALVMSEESRLGREQVETSYALKQLVQAGVEVWLYMEDRQRTLDSPTDKIMLSLAAFADELEREKARQRTKDALRRKAKAGHVTGGRAYGYRNVEILGADGERSHVEREIIPEEAAVVRRIFELCRDGYGMARITKTLNEEGAPCPRPQQGRPAGWSPSSVQGILHRDLYRGVIVWNKSKKRDSWGQRNQRPRPESEWMEVEAPDLRIVPQDLWDAAHASLDSRRANYLRATNGRLWGRPPSGDQKSKYLLVGMARCAVCGGGLEMRSRSNGRGRRRSYFYACSSYWRRGREICNQKLEIPMPAADAAVLDTLLSEVLDAERLAEVAARAVELAQERDGAPDAREGLERRLREAEAAAERLTAAIAAGGDVPSLVEALKAQEATRKRLEARLDALTAPPPTVDAAFEARLGEAVEEWRGILGRQVPLARQIVAKLLDEKLAFEPVDRDGRRGFRFEGEGTVEKLLQGAVPGAFLPLASPTGFEPVLPA